MSPESSRCARLIWLLPEGVRVEGLAPDGTWTLDPDRRTVIGRDPSCQLVVHGAAIGGRRTCTIDFDHGAWWLIHLGHAVPIQVENGKLLRAQEQSLLRDGDVVCLTTVDDKPPPRFRFEQPAGVPAPASADELL